MLLRLLLLMFTVVVTSFAKRLGRAMPLASPFIFDVTGAVFPKLGNWNHCRALQNPRIRNDPGSIALVRS